MDYIRDWETFNKLFAPFQNGVIIYGFGDVAHKVLHHLYYNNMLEGTLCCVAINDADDNLCIRHLNFPEWPDYINKLEVVDYHELPHFREDTPVLVCTAEDKHEEIYRDLTEFGFKQIKFISDIFSWCFRCSVQEIEQNSLFKIEFKLNELGKYLVDLKYQVEQQNEVCKVNTAAFAEYKNAFRGRDVVIVATGPTLKYYSPMLDAIHIGVNFAYRKDNIPLDYLFITDGFNIRENPIYQNDPDELARGFERVREKVFVGRLDRKSIYEDYRDIPADYELLSEKCAPFKANYHVSGTIYPDITTHSLADFWSVVFAAFQFALFTNPKRIFLVGCDVSSSGHFYKDDKASRIARFSLYMPFLKMGYLRIKKFAVQIYPNTEIISVNPVGLRGLFKDIYTENNLDKPST